MTPSEPRMPQPASRPTSSNATPTAPPASLVAAFIRALLHPPKVSRGRYILAICIAVIADVLFWWLGELLPGASDFVVAVLLALCLGGLRLELLVAFLAEATPGLGLLPSWTLAVPIVWMRAHATASTPETSDSRSTSTAIMPPSLPSTTATNAAHAPTLPPSNDQDSSGAP